VTSMLQQDKYNETLLQQDIGSVWFLAITLVKLYRANLDLLVRLNRPPSKDGNGYLWPKTPLWHGHGSLYKPMGLLMRKKLIPIRFAGTGMLLVYPYPQIDRHIFTWLQPYPMYSSPSITIPPKLNKNIYK